MEETVIQWGIQHKLTDVVRDTIKEVNTELSLTAEKLIERAERDTTNIGEYIAFMKGAAFIFYNIAKRGNEHSGTPSSITSIPDAITHCIKLLPFMEKDEKAEHLLLISWLNELLTLKGCTPIKLPQEYFSDKDILDGWDEIKAYTHREVHDIFESTKRI